MNARQAAKLGLCEILRGLTVGGSPAFAAVFARFPAPGQVEVRPRAVVVCRDLAFEPIRGENWTEVDAHTVAVATHDVRGSLSVLIAASGPVGATGETQAEACVEAVEQAFQDGPADELDTGLGTHGIGVVVDGYPGARFLYRLTATADAALELAERGIADAVVTVSVVGQAVRLVTTPRIASIVTATTVAGTARTKTL